MDCIFCKIISGDIPSEKVYENDKVIAFKDIAPQAPVHILVIPKTHIQNIDDLNDGNFNLMSDIFLAVKDIAKNNELDKMGYRIIINNGESAGQVVFHLHIHILGGKNNMGPMLLR